MKLKKLKLNEASKAELNLYLLLFSVFCMLACHSGNSEQVNTPSDSSALVQGDIIPFKYYGHLYFPITIDNSVQGNFVFDTGVDVLYIDSLFYYRSSLVQNYLSDASLYGIGNQVQQAKYIQHKYTCLCGSLMLQPSFTIVLNLRPITGKHLDGILGIDVLKDSIIAIDYNKEQMRILRRNKLSIEDYERIPCSIRNNRIFLRATVDIGSQNKIEGDFMLDIGYGEGIGLTAPCAKENNLAQLLPKKIRTYTNWGGIGGPSSSYIARVDAFHIGNQKIIDPTISYFEDQQGAMASKDFIGLIGNKILDRFDLIIDMPDSCLYLRPNRNFAQPFHTTFTGFSYVDRTDICDGWVVRALDKGLPAEKAGLQIGDIILSVNARETKNISFDEQKDFFHKIGETYALTIERGGQHFQLILSKEKWCL